MSIYQHILLTTDFCEYGKVVADKAQQLAECHGARLSVVHIVDDLPIADTIYGTTIPFGEDLTDQMLDICKQRLNQLGDELGIPEEQRWLEIGSPKLEIVRIAEENQVDLIIVGSHGRHGFALLLGSTANGILHHAKCDVLAVRLNDD